MLSNGVKNLLSHWKKYSAQKLKHSCVRSLYKGSCISFLYKHTKHVPNYKFQLKCEELVSSGLLSTIRFTLLADVPNSLLKDIWKWVMNIYLLREIQHNSPSTIHKRQKCVYLCTWHWLKQRRQWRFSLKVVSNRSFQKQKLCLQMLFEVTFLERIQAKTEKNKNNLLFHIILNSMSNYFPDVPSQLFCLSLV